MCVRSMCVCVCVCDVMVKSGRAEGEKGRRGGDAGRVEGGNTGKRQMLESQANGISNIGTIDSRQSTILLSFPFLSFPFLYSRWYC